KPLQHLIEIVRAERKIEIVHDFAADFPYVGARKHVRGPRPDVVVAEQGPALELEARAQCMDSRAKLLLRGLPDRVNRGRTFAAFVEWSVDVGQRSTYRFEQALAHRTGMHAYDGVDLGVREHLTGLLDEIGALVGGIDESQADFASEQAAGAIDFRGRESRASDCRRAPDP